MIVFKKVRYRNLLSTGNSWMEIDLCNHKSTLIVGDNGSGKSTILDALSFGLFGKAFRKVNKNQLVNSINQKGMIVEVYFEVGNHKFLVRRGVAPTIFEIYQNDNLIDQPADSREYQDLLEKNILKFNFKAFTQIVVIGSASFVPFMQLPAQYRREVIEDLLDIQIFSTMNVLLKQKQQDNKDSLVENNQHVALFEQRIELHQKHINALKQNNTGLVRGKENKIAEHQNEIDRLTAENKSLCKTIEELGKTIVDKLSVTKRRDTVIALNKQLNDKRGKLYEEHKFFSSNDVCPTCTQHIDNDFKGTRVNACTEQIKQINDAFAKLNEKIETVRIRLNEIEVVEQSICKNYQTINNNDTRIDTFESYNKSLKEEIKQLQTEGVKFEADEQEMLTLKGDLLDAHTKKEDIINNKFLYDIASSLLRDGGIKTRIIKQYVPIMNKLINKYLAELDFMCQFELDENFNEQIKSRYRDEFAYASFSEGEKLRIDMALLFTWRQIAKLRNSASTNLLILDEVFDKSLDMTGTDEFFKMIKSLTSETNSFIISHKPDFLLDKFDHVLVFEKHQNFSKIVQTEVTR